MKYFYRNIHNLEEVSIIADNEEDAVEKLKEKVEHLEQFILLEIVKEEDLPS